MRIAAFARQVGVSPAWLYRAERQGLIPPMPRDRNGHRRLTDADVASYRGVVMEKREHRKRSPALPAD